MSCFQEISIVFKTAIRQRALFLCCIHISFLLALVQTTTTFAASKQIHIAQAASTITLSMPSSERLSGHPGTKVTLTLRSFVPNSTVNLYTTKDHNASNCATSPSRHPFDNYSTVTIGADGSSTRPLLSNIPWPASAADPNESYYVCAVPTTTIPGAYPAITAQPFIVASDVTVTVSSSTVAAGSPITITGDNWLPPQQITVQIGWNLSSGQSTVIVQRTAIPDSSGRFSVNLTIPPNTPPGSYAVSAVATNEPTMAYEKDNAFTIGGATPTTSPTPSSTPTPSPTGTSTTSSDSNGDSGASGLTVLIFTLGGIGLLLIVIGIIMFAVSVPPTTIR
jgi:hypothetical protein